MPYTEAYREHIMYTFNGYCKTVIRFAAITAWRDRIRRRQKEISVEYLTEEKFYPLGTTDEYFEAPYEEYPITICGQTVILTNGELAAAVLSLPEKNREIIFLYFFGHYTQQEIGGMYGRCRSTTHGRHSRQGSRGQGEPTPEEWLRYAVERIEAEGRGDLLRWYPNL
jgi:DNA-directed RNA polymerase specialized sigma24 family protein